MNKGSIIYMFLNMPSQSTKWKPTEGGGGNLAVNFDLCAKVRRNERRNEELWQIDR